MSTEARVVTDSKGWRDDDAGMDTTTRSRRDELARAMSRLRTLTIGTALAGTAATVGLGWIVAGTVTGG